MPHHIYRSHPFSNGRDSTGLNTRGWESWRPSQNFYYHRQISFVCSVLYSLIVYFIYSDIWFRVYISFIVKSIKVLWLYCILQLKLKCILVSSRASPTKFFFFSKFLSCLFYHFNFNFSGNKTKIPSEFSLEVNNINLEKFDSFCQLLTKCSIFSSWDTFFFSIYNDNNL